MICLWPFGKPEAEEGTEIPPCRLQARVRVTKPIFLVIYLGQTLKPKPRGKIFEAKTPGLRSHRAGTLFPQLLDSLFLIIN